MAIDKVVDSQVLDGYFSDIADSIRLKDGTQNTYTPQEMPQAIENIPSGGGELKEKDVNFYDYDGTLLYSYNASEFAELTAMPENPTHEGLIAQGWNWDLTEAKEYVADWGRLIIGQSYITDDGATRIYVDLDEHTLTCYLNISISGSCTVDWGDNSSIDTVQGGSGSYFQNMFVGHEYNDVDSYVISIKPIDNSIITFSGRNRSIILSGTNNSSQITMYSYRAYLNKIKKIEIGNNFIWNNNSYAFAYISFLETITIPVDNVSGSGAHSIGQECFNNCRNLKALIIPRNITALSHRVAQASAIKICSIPNTITYFGDNLFNNCRSLKEITLPNANNTSSQSTFSNCYALERAIIPKLASINIFSNCYNLKHAIIMQLNTSVVYSSVFQGCERLKEIEIPPYTNNAQIPANAFTYCNSLKEIVIPEGYTTIQAAFSSCQSLEIITFPSTVTSINGNAMSNCFSLEEVHIKATTPPALSGSISEFPATCKIYVPAGSLTDYQTATNWSTYASQMEEE